MFDLISSVTLAVQGEFILLDPTLEEERLCQVPLLKAEENPEHGIVILSILDTHEQVSQFYQSGNFTLKTLTKAIDTLTKAAKDVIMSVKKCLVVEVTGKNDV